MDNFQWEVKSSCETIERRGCIREAVEACQGTVVIIESLEDSSGGSWKNQAVQYGAN